MYSEEDIINLFYLQFAQLSKGPVTLLQVMDFDLPAEDKGLTEYKKELLGKSFVFSPVYYWMRKINQNGA